MPHRDASCFHPQSSSSAQEDLELTLEQRVRPEELFLENYRRKYAYRPESNAQYLDDDSDDSFLFWKNFFGQLKKDQNSGNTNSNSSSSPDIILRSSDGISPLLSPIAQQVRTGLYSFMDNTDERAKMILALYRWDRLDYSAKSMGYDISNPWHADTAFREWYEKCWPELNKCDCNNK